MNEKKEPLPVFVGALSSRFLWLFILLDFFRKSYSELHKETILPFKTQDKQKSRLF